MERCAARLGYPMGPRYALSQVGLAISELISLLLELVSTSSLMILLLWLLSPSDSLSSSSDLSSSLDLVSSLIKFSFLLIHSLKSSRITFIYTVLLWSNPVSLITLSMAFSRSYSGYIPSHSMSKWDISLCFLCYLQECWLCKTWLSFIFDIIHSAEAIKVNILRPWSCACKCSSASFKVYLESLRSILRLNYLELIGNPKKWIYN